ncbi:MAG: VWA domain-containing protein [Desulfocapsaceae bacterium]|nr:VWA domain-containing protein [Desulfocapsaceae bacterium]
MRFLHPELLWLLTLIPFLALIRGRRGPAPALIFSTTSLASSLAAGRRTSPGRILTAVRLLACALLIVSLAEPQQGNTTTEITASGIDIMLAVDVSGSMHALDFTLHGQPANRLDVIKSVVSQFIDARPNDRIGLLAFADQPHLICPLTLDHDWLRKRLDAVSIGMVDDGTAIGSAIGAGVNRLNDKDAKSRILILLTDGMNNSGKVPPLVAAEAAETMKIKVYTIGAGTKGEAPIPVVDSFGRKRMVRMKVDIDEDTLNKIAQMTGARYFRATDTQSLEKIYEEINSMETTSRTIKNFNHYRELFPIPLLAALLLLGFELLREQKRLP